MRNVWEMSLGRMSADTFDLIISSLKDFDPLPTIFFGGIGEPLSHPELIEMVRQVKSLGARVELITNGTLLDEELSTQLIEVGLDMLWVSIDGATPESYADVRLGDALPQVIENLQRLQSLRQDFYSFSTHNNPDLGIAFVAMRRNITDLTVLQLGTQLGATHFSISNLLPYTPELASEILYNC
jgi:MoaA/NifB/PqqE/SkfB family radical SAM enzyme